MFDCVNFLGNFNVFAIISQEKGVKMRSMKKVNPLFKKNKDYLSLKQYFHNI